MRKCRSYAVALVLLCLLASCSGGSKTGYVNLSELYEQFPMKKELESQLQKTQTQRKAFLDSMYLSLQATAVKLEERSSEEANMRFARLSQDYQEKKNYFEEDNGRMVSQYNEQIWKQINQYVKDYGEANGYDYIFGLNGNGGIMYSREGLDLTKAVGEYISEKYKGKMP